MSAPAPAVRHRQPADEGAVVALLGAQAAAVVATVADPADEGAYVPALTRLGYRVAVREPDWFEHRCLRHDWPRVNLHVFGPECPETAAMLRFRDHVRSDPVDRSVYAEAKQRLAARDWVVVQDYADAKSDVVTTILGRAGIPRRHDAVDEPAQ